MTGEHAEKASALAAAPLVTAPSPTAPPSGLAHRLIVDGPPAALVILVFAIIEAFSVDSPAGGLAIMAIGVLGAIVSEFLRWTAAEAGTVREPVTWQRRGRTRRRPRR